MRCRVCAAVLLSFAALLHAEHAPRAWNATEPRQLGRAPPRKQPPKKPPASKGSSDRDKAISAYREKAVAKGVAWSGGEAAKLPSLGPALPVTRGSIRVDVADEDDDDPLELVETACRWVPDTEHFANVSSRGCCPHAVTVYGERYGSIDARCCRDDHHRSISPLRLECDATDTATPLLGSLSNRTVVFLGDSIAEQYFVGTACALWEDGEHVEIADSMPESAYIGQTPVLR